MVLPIPSLESLPNHTPDNPLSIERQLFRERIPYDVVDVSRIPMVSSSDPPSSGSSEWTPPTDDKVEIWGLTGWFLDVLLRRFGVWQSEKDVTGDTNSRL